MSESLLLKWGTIKGWDLSADNEKCKEILQQWADMGDSYSCMAQKDTPEQKQLICELIDAFDGEIQNDWSGEMMTKDEAKEYVMTYRA
jgi:hypothetical protein